MSIDANRNIFQDGEVYQNPFWAMLEHGKDWAADGMSREDMMAAAEQLGGVALGRNGPKNLAGYADELITRTIQSQTTQGEL